MGKKNVALVLGSTKDFFYATGPVVLNIKKFSPDLADDIVIYYDDIAERDRDILVDELGCRLIPYDCPLKVSPDATDALQRFTLLSFSIYEIFGLLDEYRQVLWLDSDICIQDDISGILEYGPVGIRHGGSKLGSAMGRKVNPALDDLPTNNTGVVLVTDELAADYRALREQCYFYTERFIKTLFLPDQAVLNYVLFKNNISITDLTSAYNYTGYHSLHGYSAAKIFHLPGEIKFWNHSLLRKLFPVWDECYKKWLDMGGSAYAGEQLFTEIGDKFSLLDLLAAVSPQGEQLLESKRIIAEQKKSMQRMSKSIDELLALVKSMQPPAGDA